MKAGFSQRDRRRRPTFLTKDSPAMSVVEQAGLLALVDPATLAQVAPLDRGRRPVDGVRL
jgi:hypothetical protein